MKLNQRADGESAAYRQIRLAMDLMSVDLENAVPYDFTRSYPDKTAFQGEDNAVTFLLASGKGLKVIRYYLDSPEGGSIHKVIVGVTHSRNVDTLADYREEKMKSRNLVREEWNFLAYLSGAAGETHAAEIIAVNVLEDSLKFSFGHAGGQDYKASDAYEWREQWKEDYIPFTVHIEMDFLLPGPALRVITMHKDVLIPHGSWGTGELGKGGKNIIENV